MLRGMAVVAVLLGVAASCGGDGWTDSQIYAASGRCNNSVDAFRADQDRVGGELAGRSETWWFGYSLDYCDCIVELQEYLDEPDPLNLRVRDVRLCEAQAVAYANNPRPETR